MWDLGIRICDSEKGADQDEPRLTMMAVLLVLLMTSVTFVGELYSQKAEKARLVGTWFGGEDPSEFIYHSVEEFAVQFLPDNPDGKIVARVCSARPMSEALARSSRVVKALPVQASSDRFRIPAEKVFFARSSKCEHGDQYWFVSGNIDIEYDELVLAERFRINTWWTIDYGERIDSVEGKKEFTKDVREFVSEVKNNAKSEGYLFPSRRYQIGILEEQLKAAGIDGQRVRISKERPRDTYHPVLVTIAVH
jgi:hypothetical protein